MFLIGRFMLSLTVTACQQWIATYTKSSCRLFSFCMIDFIYFTHQMSEVEPSTKFPVAVTNKLVSLSIN